jgi:hypothetical protein
MHKRTTLNSYIFKVLSLDKPSRLSAFVAKIDIQESLKELTQRNAGEAQTLSAEASA